MLGEESSDIIEEEDEKRMGEMVLKLIHIIHTCSKFCQIINETIIDILHIQQNFTLLQKPRLLAPPTVA